MKDAFGYPIKEGDRVKHFYADRGLKQCDLVVVTFTPKRVRFKNGWLGKPEACVIFMEDILDDPERRPT